MLGAMTEPQFGGSEYGSTPPPPPQQPPYPPPPGQYPPPPGYGDPTAPYGRHPMTGEPYSDKSKTLAGLLQLLGIIGVLGVGRIYIGQTAFGIVQLLLGLLFYCIGVGIVWGIIDCIILMTGNHRDTYGRPLRDGT